MSSHSKPGIIFIHGWTGYRVGPHQMFIKAARQLSQRGYYCLRFDFTGRGDSEGGVSETNFHTMILDTRAAIDWFVRALRQETVTLVGISYGSEVAMLTAELDCRVRFLVLWSPGKRPSLPTSSLKEAQRKRALLQEYMIKSVQLSTWIRLFRGEINFGLIIRGLRNRIERKAVDCRTERFLRMLDPLVKFRGRACFIYGTGDPQMRSSLEFHQSLCQENGITAEFHGIEGANHSFYSLAHGERVIETTIDWLEEQNGKNWHQERRN